MPGEVSAGIDSALRDAGGHSRTDTPLPKQGSKNTTAVKPGASGATSAASAANGASCDDTAKPASGNANMSDAPPVSYLATVPPNSPATAFLLGANAGASSQAAGATCPVAPPAQPNSPARIDAAPPAWKQQLSRCSSVNDFVDLLKSRKDPEEQKYIVDTALLRFMDLDDIDDLAKAVKGDPSLRKSLPTGLYRSLQVTKPSDLPMSSGRVSRRLC